MTANSRDATAAPAITVNITIRRRDAAFRTVSGEYEDGSV